MAKRRAAGTGVAGAVWLTEPGAAIGGGRIALLEKIGELGSISKAARAVGISYRTAWTAVDGINNLFERPLVSRSAGGRGGGGTALTDEGRDVVRRYRIVEREHGRFLASLSGAAGDRGAFERLLRRLAMRVSARNVFLGQVAKVRRGAVNAEVDLSLRGGDAIVAVVTNASVDDLGLAPGREAYAIVKASSVLLGTDLHASRISARNVLCGTVSRIVEGPVNAEVSVSLAGGNVLTAVVTEESVRRLRLSVGGHACAAVKASSVILGVA